MDKNKNDDFDVYVRHSIDECFEYVLLAQPLENFLSEHWVETV